MPLVLFCAYLEFSPSHLTIVSLRAGPQAGEGELSLHFRGEVGLVEGSESAD
jgi:hypothetical protein